MYVTYKLSFAEVVISCQSCLAFTISGVKECTRNHNIQTISGKKIADGRYLSGSSFLWGAFGLLPAGYGVANEPAQVQPAALVMRLCVEGVPH